MYKQLRILATWTESVFLELFIHFFLLMSVEDLDKESRIRS